MGLGTESGPDRIRSPSPPQNSTTFMTAPPHGWIGTSRQYLKVGQRDDKSTTPRTHVIQLGRDLLAQVPRQNQHVIGSAHGDLVHVVDRNVRTGQELAVFERIPVDRERQQVR